MDIIEETLKTTAHRQYALPKGPWMHYQEWHENLLLHWQIDSSAITPLLPEGLHIDTINGQSWVSLIAFSVKNLRPRFLPACTPISNFHEVNFRTYVTRNGIPGIYFISIEAEKVLPALLARLLVGLPYKKSEIKRTLESYYSRNNKRNFRFKAEYHPVATCAPVPSNLDYWLTERHALYQQNGSILHRLDIHHKPWPLQPMKIEAEISGYPLIGGQDIRKPDLVHYARYLAVLVWTRITVPNDKRSS